MPALKKIETQPTFNGSADSFDQDKVRAQNPAPQVLGMPRSFASSHPLRSGEAGYLQALDEHKGSLAVTITVAQAVTRSYAAGAELVREVDDGASLKRLPYVSYFTEWVEVEADGSFVRLSEARTAGYGGGAVRAMVMSGLAVERTVDPELAREDIRNIRTMYVLSPVSTKGGYCPEGLPEVAVGYGGSFSGSPAQIYDLASAEDEGPYSIGPLYSGHPNEVKGNAPIERVRAFTEELARCVEYDHRIRSRS